MRKPMHALCLTLTIGLLLLSVVGCTPTTTATTPTAQPTDKATAAPTAGATANADVTEPIDAAPWSGDPVELEYFWDSPELYNGWEWGNDPITQYITEQTGVSLKVRYAASNNHEELYTMLAAGTNFPDMIRCTYVPALYDEQYALSWNKLADDYCPEFYDVLPYQYQEVHAMPDGDIYYMGRDFGDSQKLAEIPGGSKSVSTFFKNIIYWQELGSPPLDTLEQVRDAAKLAKDAGSEYPIILTTYGPTNDMDYLQITNLSFGGPQYVYQQADGTATFNIKSETYKNAAQWLNSLYKDGLIQADNFTFTTSNDENMRELAQAGDPLIGIGHEWQLRQYRIGMDHAGCYMPMMPPLAEGVTYDDIVMKDYNASNIGEVGGVFIMADTEYPDRCIQFITFMLQGDTQLLVMWGREGTDYTMDYSVYQQDGYYKITDELAQDQANMDNPAYMNKWGYLNSLNLMVLSRWGNSYMNRPYNEAYPEEYAGMQIYVGSIFAKPFKVLALATKFTDTDEQLLYNNVIKEWQAGQAEMVLAPDAAAFEAAYTQTIANMEKVGLAELEALLTERYNYWSERIQE